LGGFGPALEFGSKTLPDPLIAKLASPDALLEIAAAKGDARFIAAAVTPETNEDVRRMMFKIAVETAKCSLTEQIALADMAIEMNEPDIALRLIKIVEALAAGTASDFYKIGLLYEKLSTPFGEENKLAAFAKAANLGHFDAARRLVDEQLSSNGTALDFAMLKSQLPEIARVAVPSKLFGLAGQILNAKVDSTKISPVEKNQMAQYLYVNAAKRGHIASMRELGLGINSGNFSATDGHDGYHWLEKAAKADDKIALRTLSVAYYNGLGVVASREKSLIFLEKAAKLGDKASVKLLAGLKKFESANP
jgi:TPR repeat protein